MTKPRRPRKPARFPSHIALPKHGPARRVVEPLPQTQAELELAIGAKFLGAMEHFEGISLGNLAPGVEPADLRCTDEAGRSVAIQVVEAIDQRLRSLQEMRAEYLTALREIQTEFAGDYSGCAAAIVDSGEPPYLPRVRTDAGRRSLDRLLRGIQEIGKTIRDLPVGRLTRRDVHLVEPSRTVSLLITRHEAASTPDRFMISWEGGGPAYRVDLPRGVLPAAVRSKLAKHYTPVTDKFILLVYSIDTMIAADEPDVHEAKRLLTEAEHPFDEVWYLYPYAEATLGHLVRVWPVPTAG